MKSYHIHRDLEEHQMGEVTITVKEGDVFWYRLELEPSLKVANHSPTGFEFGYGGSGPAQTALAILLDFTNDERLAQCFHQDFKWKFIGGIQHPGGVIEAQEIEKFLKAAREKKPDCELEAW